MRLEEFNAQQRQVVEAHDGPLMVVAGPGTGKTKTLTARIVRLIQAGKALPSQIVAVTFTVKAAAEMRARVAAQLTGPQPVITTFHGFCYELLKAHHHVPEQFATEPERAAIIAALPRPDTLAHCSIKELTLFISRYKNAIDHTAFDPAVGRLSARYNQALTKADLGDFDNLLVEASQLAAEPTVQAELRQRCRYFLVDEFQDTNELQYSVLRQIPTNNIMVIGDPLQSIYGFRGASSAIFETFAQDYPQVQKVTLTTNYRSTKAVVSLAKTIYPDLQLAAHSQEAGQVRIVRTLHEYAEAAFIVRTIEARLGGTNLLTAAHTDDAATGFRDFAVIYRTHHAARIVQQQFVESGIPYQVVGEESPYARPAITALLRLLIATLKGSAIDERTHQSLSALKHLSLEQINQNIAALGDSGQTPSQLAQRILDKLNIVLKPSDQPVMAQCMNMLVQFDTQSNACAAYLERLLQADYYDSQAEAVTLTTIHAAKGLEFPHVFLCAAEEGVLPHGRVGTVLDEERRLLYVAATRPKQRLDITFAATRARQPTEPSRFLTDLTGYEIIDDPATPDLQKRAHRRQLKSRQKTLFDF